jgi:tight adherence protein B
MLPIIISISVFIGVAALIWGIALLMRGNADESLEDRLDILAGINKKPSSLDSSATVLTGPLNDVPGQLERFVSRVTNLRLMIDQADLSITPTNLILISLGMAAAGVAIGYTAGMTWYFLPAMGILPGILPFFWLKFVRKRRVNAFAKQLPEAMELLARALRAGHSMQAGCQLIGDEMPAPIGKEFNRAFEEQNLGVTLEESLNAMTERVPNMDLRFFATAVILQRQTGGDLAEILDKIGRLIRDRFKLFGQIQALTGEGRLSGIVLLAMPPVLFLVMLRLNYEYAMILLTDDMGKRWLAMTIVLQLVGAWVIKKIVSIKV